MSMNDQKTNQKMFKYATWIAIVNQSLLPTMDQAYIDPKNFPLYVKIQVVSVVFYILNLAYSKWKGYRDLHLHLFMGYTFLWGSVCQFIIPSAYLSYLIILFVYAIFLRVKSKVFFSISGVAFVLTCLAILNSPASYSETELLQEKFKADAIQTLVIISVFICIAHFIRLKELAKSEYIESKFFNLGSQSANIIHDIKGQIIPPLNYVKMLKDQNLDKDSEKEILVELNHCLEEMKKYILEVNQIFSLKKEKGLVNLKELVAKVSVIFEAKVKNIEVDIVQDGEVEVDDITCFKSMIYNLLMNSAEAFSSQNITKDKKVMMTFNKDYFEYRDNAGGIPESYIKKIKNNDFLSTKKEGSGLGLYFITKYVENSGYTMNLSNKEGGIYFKINFKKG